MDTSSLCSVLESLNKTSKGQLAYARDPLSACSTLDNRSFTISREKVSINSPMLLSERFKKLEIPSKNNEWLLDMSYEPQRIRTEEISLKQMRSKEISLRSPSVNKEESTPVYNMSFEMMLQLFEENESAPKVSIICFLLFQDVF